MNELMLFEGNEVEIFEYEGKILFNPKHVAKCLDITDVKSSIRNFSNTQKVKITNKDLEVHSMHFRKLHNTGETFLTEAGVYKLIFKSRKEEAERFQDWVTDEVLPQIRKTGNYSLSNNLPTEVNQMLDCINKQQEQIDKVVIKRQNIKKQREERLGKENYNRFGTLMKIVEYNGVRDITVEFQDKYKVRIKNREYKEFIKGGIKNPYDKEICGVGYIGVGKYKISKENEKTREYYTWRNMIKRCYDPYWINKHLTYIDCYVCEEWHNFQNFAKWWEENYYEIEGETMHLDKDILIKGNKVYSPETCIIVPQRINELFVKGDKIRGKYPIGVYEFLDKRRGSKSLRSQCNILNNKKKLKKCLGYFPLNKPFQAFYTYKVFKENYIKQVANEYKDFIPQNLYNAMYKWKVEIND